MGWLDSITDSTDTNLSKLKDREGESKRLKAHVVIHGLQYWRRLSATREFDS